LQACNICFVVHWDCSFCFWLPTNSIPSASNEIPLWSLIPGKILQEISELSGLRR
jgi:hypothetical protein